MLQLPRQRQGRRALMTKQQLARPPAAVTPAASPAAGSETAATALPAASATLSNFGQEGPGGKKMGISAAAGTVNQTCVFIGLDLDGPIGSALDGKGFRTALCWDPTGATQEI